MTTSRTPSEAHAAALLLFGEGGLSCAEIGERTGSSKRSVKRWKADWKKSGGQPRAGAPAAALARELAAADEAVATAAPSFVDDPVGHWTAMLDQADGAVTAAMGLKQLSGAATWARIADTRRGKLEEAQILHAQAEADRELRGLRDPSALARRLLKVAPVLARVCPDLARKIADEIIATLPGDG